jgi:hypothetical protein
MTELFEIVQNFFTDEEWYFMQLDNRTILKMGFKGDNGEWTCYAQINEELALFYFYSIVPVMVPEEKRPAIAEFITRANYGLRVGNFELDYSDGEVRYKTSIDVENDRLSASLLSNLVYANIWTTDRYLPGILSIIYGNTSPQEAIDKIENPEP